MKKSAREKYLPRLILPERPEKSDLNFYTAAGTKIASAYTRVVIGERGPYIEFSDEQIIKSGLFIPDNQLWRLTYDCYYDEWRSQDEAFVKVYYQKREVDYADYKIGYWYISPFALLADNYPLLIRRKDADNNN